MNTSFFGYVPRMPKPKQDLTGWRRHIAEALGEDIQVDARLFH